MAAIGNDYQAVASVYNKGQTIDTAMHQRRLNDDLARLAGLVTGFAASNQETADMGRFASVSAKHQESNMNLTTRLERGGKQASYGGKVRKSMFWTRAKYEAG